MKNNVGINGLIDQDQDIIIKISDIIKKYKYEVVEVPMCSGDNFINDNEKENEIKNTTNCYAVDMDCASIAHVCNKNNVLSVIIREINNNDNIVKSCRVIEKIVDSL